MNIIYILLYLLFIYRNAFFWPATYVCKVPIIHLPLKYSR